MDPSGPDHLFAYAAPATLATKGRAMRCTVLGFTSNLAAVLRTLMPPARAALIAQPACPRSAAGQVVYLHAWPAVGQRARALELSSARTRQRRPTSETSPCRPAWSYRDPADAETSRCRAREARTGTPQGLSGCAPSDRRSTPSRRRIGAWWRPGTVHRMPVFHCGPLRR